jgi:hypothetical protein
MKKIVFIVLLIAHCSLLIVNAQDKKEEPKFGIKFSGFVKTDINYDTRQTVNIREGHFLLYPENFLYDANKKDINAKPNLNMLAIQSRLKGVISGPDAFGAKTSGVIEADFFGNENGNFSDVNGFRLRHAFVKLNWKSTELLAGQYWHPMFIAESFPDVISFNTGSPFQPFSRNPQLRLTQTFGPLSLIATVFSQRDFQATGPDGSSTKYLRNSGMPNANFQLQFRPDSTEHIFGIGIDYKVQTPRLFSEVTITKAKITVDSTTWIATQVPAVTAKYKVDEKIQSFSALAFAKLKFKPLTVKFEGVYAQNATDMLMIGGYGVSKVADAKTEELEYTNLTTASLWADIQTNGKKIQGGLFVGYSKNIGSDDDITGAIYARGYNSTEKTYIDYLYRIAPRVAFISGKLTIAFELEYTFAMYGTANGDKKGGVTNGAAVDNTRGLLAFIYKF